MFASIILVPKCHSLWSESVTIAGIRSDQFNIQPCLFNGQSKFVHVLLDIGIGDGSKINRSATLGDGDLLTLFDDLLR